MPVQKRIARLPVVSGPCRTRSPRPGIDYHRGFRRGRLTRRARSPIVLNFPEIDPVAVAIGPVAIRWYGLAYVAGIGIGWWLGRRRAARRPLARMDAAARRRPHLLHRARRGAGGTYRLRSLLRILPLRLRSPARRTDLGRGDVLPRRTPRGDRGHGVVRAPARLRVLSGRRLPRPAGATRARGRPHRELRQRRAVGQAVGGSVGDGLSRRRSRGAPSEPALRGGARGARPLRDPVVVLPSAPPPDGGVGAVPRRLRRGKVSGRARSRAGCPHRLPRLRLGDHGPAPVGTDAARRRDDAVVGGGAHAMQPYLEPLAHVRRARARRPPDRHRHRYGSPPHLRPSTPCRSRRGEPS